MLKEFERGYICKSQSCVTKWFDPFFVDCSNDELSRSSEDSSVSFEFCDFDFVLSN
jgi:hypothetical protein